MLCGRHDDDDASMRVRVHHNVYALCALDVSSSALRNELLVLSWSCIPFCVRRYSLMITMMVMMIHDDDEVHDDDGDAVGSGGGASNAEEPELSRCVATTVITSDGH